MRWFSPWILGLRQKIFLCCGGQVEQKTLWLGAMILSLNPRTQTKIFPLLWGPGRAADPLAGCDDSSQSARGKSRNFWRCIRCCLHPGRSPNFWENLSVDKGKFIFPLFSFGGAKESTRYDHHCRGFHTYLWYHRKLYNDYNDY